MTSGTHLQETCKPRLTPAARQRQEMTNTMLAFVKKNTEKDADSSDDELDLSFAGMAK